MEFININATEAWRHMHFQCCQSLPQSGVIPGCPSLPSCWISVISYSTVIILYFTILNIFGFWSWNSNTLATCCKELTHLKRPWCWERLRACGEGDDRRWDGWMASPTQWTWVWVDSGSWWWTGRPGVLQFMWLQRVGHDWATELNWIYLVLKKFFKCQHERVISGLKFLNLRKRITILWCDWSEKQVWALLYYEISSWPSSSRKLRLKRGSSVHSPLQSRISSLNDSSGSSGHLRRSNSKSSGRGWSFYNWFFPIDKMPCCTLQNWLRR